MELVNFWEKKGKENLPRTAQMYQDSKVDTQSNGFPETRRDLNLGRCISLYGYGVAVVWWSSIQLLPLQLLGGPLNCIGENVAADVGE